MNESYEVFVAKDYFKFNAAHFQVYDGFRERLHGHNYRVSVRVEGRLGPDGYVIDFGDIKKAAREICDELDERVIVPSANDTLAIEERDGQVEISCQDGSRFSLPAGDCVLLPIAHSSAEELASYLAGRFVEGLGILPDRGAQAIEIVVEEAPGQEARCRLEL